MRQPKANLDTDETCAGINLTWIKAQNLNTLQCKSVNPIYKIIFI